MTPPPGPGTMLSPENAEGLLDELREIVQREREAGGP